MARAAEALAQSPQAGRIEADDDEPAARHQDARGLRERDVGIGREANWAEETMSLAVMKRIADWIAKH